MERAQIGGSPASAPVSGTDTVTVACKVPGGLVIQGYTWIEDYEPIFGGGSRMVKKAEATGERFTIRGPAGTMAAMKRGIIPDEDGVELAGNTGFILTPGCPRELWEQWSEYHKTAPYVRLGLVFAADNRDRARDQARELHNQETGFEGIDPNDPGKKTGQGKSITKGDNPNA